VRLAGDKTGNGDGDKSDGNDDKVGVRASNSIQWRGWQAIDGDKGDGDGDGNDVGDGDGDEAGGRRSGQG